MWLTKQLFSEKGLKLQDGRILSDEGNYCVQGESKYEFPETLLPYGYSCTAAGGQRAVMLGGYCAGTVSAPDGRLKEGEICISSNGGAEILLLQTGEVVINGQIFAPKA